MIFIIMLIVMINYGVAIPLHVTMLVLLVYYGHPEKKGEHKE